MIILDTDAFSHIQQRNPVGLTIEARLERSSDRNIRFTTVTAYEILKGAISLVELRKKERKDLIAPLDLVGQLVRFVGRRRKQMMPYDEKAEQIFVAFPPRLRQELKDDARIAAVALVHGAAVWTCNVGDFSRVPGLTFIDARIGPVVP